ncbi:MAG TPA: tRNA uridine-5-carboxymethylaminomethyl(34) synthesis GTPase MnmE, partial [Candidatus Ratteibacteria bacterium]|nr:tRNA uridine-5-carboxymethylaminomethyl(34) synthesis GTPase MnmE [Candidatus Ratteibacteria bacterium]
MDFALCPKYNRVLNEYKVKVMKKDTICAISTPLGVNGIGIVRLSGPDTYKIIEEIFVAGKNLKQGKRIKIKDIPSHTIHYGYIVEGRRRIDEVLLTIMKSPKTYTKEDIAEINCHGGIIPLKEVLSVCIKKGARLASPGEFTMRAFLNGRIDLTQAESVLEIITSQTEKSLEISLLKLEGSFSEKINNIKEKIVRYLSQFEYLIDFPEEEDIKAIERVGEKEIDVLIKEIEKIISSSKRGKILFEGVKVAIIGRTNVGKSSLLNKLIEEERAIVSEIPGTTRDIIQEVINIKGIPVKIIDTAGIRKTKGKIEKMGVEKAVEWMKKAEINILILDGSQKLKKDDKKLFEKIKGNNYIIAINKVDLPLKIEIEKIKKIFSDEKIVFISAKEGKGIDELKEKIFKIVEKGEKVSEGEIYLNLRQEELIRKLKKALIGCLNSIKKNLPLEISTEYLRQAICEIDYLTGNR